ncbi:MAG: TusE/DsrC/DsvC family sulfur relay protein [Polyangiaceae bacterium]
MAEMQVAGKNIPVNGEGFLEDPKDWTPDVAQELAKGSGIQLTERHWDVLRFCRSDWESTGQAPGLRRITKVGGIPTKELYALFPGGPGKLSAKLAGLHKPAGCV